MESDAVSEGAKAALRNSAEGVWTARKVADKAKQLGLLLLDLANFGRAAARHVAEKGLKTAASTGQTLNEKGQDAAKLWRDIRKTKLKKAVRDVERLAPHTNSVGIFSGLIAAVVNPYFGLGVFVVSMSVIYLTLTDDSEDAPDDPSEDETSGDESPDDKEPPR
jgi:Fe2+ transport system protein B